ncbi:MAG: hypothetical protein ACKVK5_10670 [Pseudomonadales bacterium]
MANKTYTVLQGSFRRADDTTAGPGEQIELAEDVAKLHRARLREVKPAPLQPLDVKPAATKPLAAKVQAGD